LTVSETLLQGNQRTEKPGLFASSHPLNLIANGDGLFNQRGFMHGLIYLKTCHFRNPEMKTENKRDLLDYEKKFQTDSPLP
jgi:hypothetical protein